MGPWARVAEPVPSSPLSSKPQRQGAFMVMAQLWVGKRVTPRGASRSLQLRTDRIATPASEQ